MVLLCVCLSDAEVSWLHRLEYFTNNFMADSLGFLLTADINITYLLTPKFWPEYGWGR